MTTLGRSSVTVVGGFRSSGPVVRLLVLSQLAFNVGFFMVLPYLSVHLAQDLAQGTAVVGAILGIRTLSQQGLFLVGGALSDRLGPRPVVLAGCACRVVGFITLGFSGSVMGVLVGAVLTGFAGALFSPAVEAVLARASERESADRLDAFALFTAFGQMGTFLGPLVGAALLTVDFTAACLSAAGLFVLIGCAHGRWLPHDARTGAPGSSVGDRPGWRYVLGDRRFLAFAAVMSVQLIAYNQLYLLLPLEVDRAWGSQTPLGGLFATASLLVVAAQLPISATVARSAPVRAVTIGFAVMAAGFLLAAAGAAAGLRGWAALGPLAGFVVVFTCGQMITGPTTRALIPLFSGNRRLGSYYGAFASVAGIAVLPASILTGAIVDAGPTAGPGAAVPWLAMAALLLIAAAGTGTVVTGQHQHHR